MAASCDHAKRRPRARPRAPWPRSPTPPTPAMPGSRSRTSVVTAPHRTPAKPSAIARDPPRQAAAANSSAAASVKASKAGRADKLATGSLESGNEQRRQHACGGKHTIPICSLRGFMTALPCCSPTTRSVRSISPIRPEARIAGGQQRCPDLDGLAVIGARQQPRADAGLGAGRQLGDDGADQRDRDRDLEAGEQIGHRRRPAQLCQAPVVASPTMSASGRAASDRAR